MHVPSIRVSIVGKTAKKILLGVAIIVTAGLLAPVLLVAGLPQGLVFAGLIGTQLFGVSKIFSAFELEFDLGAGSRLLAENLSIFSSATAVRTVLFGQVGIAGQILFRENIKNSGDTPDELLIILGLGGYPVTSLEKFWFNETLVFDGDSTTGPGLITTGKFANELVVDFRTGEETTAAFPGIAALSTSWNAKNRILRGIPCVGIRVKITEKVDGKLQPLAQIKGAKLYDPRLDSTVPGGSGAHRFNDPTTWAYSVNPKLAELLYLRGADVNGTRIFGMGKAAAAIDIEDFAAEANICEEQIDVVGGGTIDRYAINGLLIPSSNHKRNLQRLLTASAGTMDASGGIYRTFAGSWRASSMTLTEADIDGAPSDVQLQIDQSTEINIIGGSYAEPTEMWVVKEYPELVDSASIASFGENAKKLDLPFTIDHRMAQRISKVILKRLNAKRLFNANYWLRALSLQPGDIVTQTYTRYDITAETFRVDFWLLEATEDPKSNRRLIVPMRLVEEQQSWFDWDETTEEKSANTGGLLPPTADPPVGTTAGFTKNFEYDDLDTTQLAAGPSRYAMLSDSGNNTSGTQNNFHLTEAILINKEDLNGFNSAAYIANLQPNDRVVFFISITRWHHYKITSKATVVGTGTATAYKFNVSLIEKIDGDASANQPTASGNTVEFQFFKPLDDSFNILLDPDFDLTTDIKGSGAGTDDGFWISTFNDLGSAGAFMTFQPGLGAGGSNALDIKRGDSGAQIGLQTLRKARVSYGAFEFRIKYKTLTAGFDANWFSVFVGGFEFIEDTTAIGATGTTVNLPLSLNTWTTARIVVDVSQIDDAVFWQFGFNFNTTTESVEVRIDSIYVYGISGIFGTETLTDPNGPTTFNIEGMVPKSDTTADAGKVLQADGTWVSNVAGASNFNDLNDVDLTGAADNDLLYRSAGNWIDTAGLLTWDGSDLRATNIGGILEANLVDKNAIETIAQLWHFHAGIHLDDNDEIQLGSAVGGDIQIDWDGVDLEVAAAVAGSTINFRDNMNLRVWDASNSGSLIIEVDEVGGGYILFNSGGVAGFKFQNSNIFIEEGPIAAADQTGFGQWWTRNDAPNTPMFTDDTGIDHVLNEAAIITSVFTRTGAVVAQIGDYAAIAEVYTALQTFGGHAAFLDNDEIRFGTGNDIQVKWDAVDLEVTAAVAGSTINLRNNMNLRIFDSADTGSVTIEVDTVGGGYVLFNSGGVAGFKFLNSNIFIEEIPTAAADQTGFGQWWVRNDAPNTPMFTTDTGVDIDLTAGEANVVDSVFGRTGAVLALTGDYAAFYLRPGDPEIITALWHFHAGIHLNDNDQIQFGTLAGGDITIDWDGVDLEVEAAVAGSTINFRDNMNLRIWDSANTGSVTIEVDTVGGGYVLFNSGGVAGFKFLNSNIFIEEGPIAAADQTGFGQFWVRNDAPNTPMFTDDTGIDHDLSDTGVGGIGTILAAIKTADESVVNDTLQDDDHLTITLLNGKTYEINLYLRISSASSTPNFQFAFTTPGSSEGHFGVEAPQISTVVVAATNIGGGQGTWDTTLAIGLTANIHRAVMIRGTIKAAAAGDLKLRWSQNTTNATATFVREFSTMIGIQLD